MGRAVQRPCAPTGAFAAVSQDVQPAFRAEVFIHFHGKYTSPLYMIRFNAFQRDVALSVSGTLRIFAWISVRTGKPENSSPAEDLSMRLAFHSAFSRLTSLLFVCFRQRCLNPREGCEK